ncbi:MAG: GNAT family N-acetyltransferase [Bdellovibrionota bacterium]|nr:GNAT family N-acetyltransferase [Bdellovibrionota bacterium]
MTIKTINYTELNDTVIKDIHFLDEQVFEKALSIEKISRELSTKHNISILITYVGDEPAAYKVGFERSSRMYYSWIGGVSPVHRGKGLAKELMNLQHDFARKHNYRVVCTQTDKRFKEMLILNLKCGFDVVGTIQSTGDSHLTLVLEKNLELQ